MSEGLARPALVLALLLGGCGGIDEQADYAESLARAACTKMERCELGAFEADFSSREDCIRERADQIEDGNKLQEDADCEYLPVEAGRCVRRVSSLSCEEWSEGEIATACDLVYLCDDPYGGLPTSTTVTVD